jgi:hypothetical protein
VRICAAVTSNWYAKVNIEHMFVTSAASIPIGMIHAAAAGRPDLALSVTPSASC